MKKFGTAFPQFIEPASDQGFEFLPARAVGMLSKHLPAELEPDLLHRIGRGERRSVKAASEYGCVWPPGDHEHSHGNALANYPGRCKSHRRQDSASRRSKKSGTSL